MPSAPGFMKHRRRAAHPVAPALRPRALAAQPALPDMGAVDAAAGMCRVGAAMPCVARPARGAEADHAVDGLRGGISCLGTAGVAAVRADHAPRRGIMGLPPWARARIRA